ncbi:MAG: UDP-N-acetylglucosamine 1-carboxyvinyltransferase [bacterium]|nr:UDP-N-acetylglucosamine 1-carboxyvinyltransferase [bacterium]
MQNEKFLIKGLGGKKVLNGEIKINGAKNAGLKAIAGTFLFKDEVVLNNIPDTEDIKKLCKLLELSGAEIKKVKNGNIKISTKNVKNYELDGDTAKSMRASAVVTGPMLARYGKVIFPAPGGCVIGERPIDLLLNGYEKMGAKIELKNDKYIITASGGKLKGAEIFFNVQTVGGTETLMMAGVLAKGKTILRNCAMEPEIVNLAEYLVSCGAKIKGIGTTTMEIIGGGLLSSKGKVYKTIPDRIEAGSYLILGALCANNLRINKCEPKHLESLTNLLTESGVALEIGKDFIQIKNNGKIPNNKFRSFNIRTHEYPGFPTDLQAPIGVFLTQTTGEGIIFETIYEGRFKYAEELLKLGAEITIMNPREVLIKGGAPFKALCNVGDNNEIDSENNSCESCEELEAHDIRAGFATVIGALLAEGDSIIKGIRFIDRGYEKLEERLNSLGADIKRIHSLSSII